MKQWLIDEKIWSIINSINALDSFATLVFIFSKSDELEYDKNLKFIEMNFHYEASKLNAKVQYQLLNCIDENDAKMMIEKTKVKNIWNRLVNKYKIKLQTIERQYFVELVNYKKFSNMNIEFIYIDITKKSRKIAKLQSNMKSIALLARRFQTLLQSLLDEYNIIRDVIDAQINSNIETSIQKLQEKKTQLQIKNKKMIMLIKDDNRKVDHSHDRDRQRSTYRISQRRRFDNFNNIERRHKHRENKFKFKQSDCFLCDANHRIKNCSLLRELKKLFTIVKFDTFRLFLVIVTLEDLKCYQVDVNNAFTKSFLKKVIYMKSSLDVDLRLEQTLLIRRSLYELKQATRNWHERCVKKLFKLSFEQCVANFCMLRHKERNIILLIYVDDICIVAFALHQVQWFKDEFQKMFKVKNLRKMRKIFDIRIIKNRERRTLRMNQSHYLSEVLDELHMSVNKHEKTKFSMSDYDAFRSIDFDDRRINSKNYQHKIEKLMYAIMHTRSNICFALERLNQYLNDLANHHEQVLKTLLRYIRFTIDLDIEYELFESNESFKSNESMSFYVNVFSNSNYASNRLNKKSILEYVYMFVERSISWMSRKQKSIATFIIETKYMILFTCVKKDLWIAQFLRDLKLSKYLETQLDQMTIVENIKHETCSSMQLYENNQATNFLVKDAHIHERSKHIDVTYHHVKDTYNKNLIQLNYFSINDMIVDDLTKSLVKNKFKNFVKLLRLQRSKINESRLNHVE